MSEYNAIAQKIMTENNIAIDDLNAHITPKIAELQRPKDVHFVPQGSEYLAQKVAESIEAQLPKK